jgi:alkylation response protein AidB-like acyl-CoA dehydrogenase
VDVLSTAERLADEVLFPAALATDTADAVPVDLLDTLAEVGLYGLSGPVSAGGVEADFPTVCSVVEKLASGCLTLDPPIRFSCERIVGSVVSPRVA